MKYILLITANLMIWNLPIKAQVDLLEVEGAIRISDADDPSPDPGTIRWSGSDFEGWNGLIWASLSGKGKIGTVSDIEGNSYKTITIGTQEWMTENLRVSQYNNGTAIGQVTENLTWNGLNTGAWCWYNNDNSHEIPYGKLYNWEAVNTGNLCPIGWHVPTDAEWTVLIDFLDPSNVNPNAYGTQSLIVGGKMKLAGLTKWNSPNQGATNESNWSGISGGGRLTDGNYIGIGNYGCWWSSTPFGASEANYRWMYFNTSISYRSNEDQKSGFSVRCIKD